MKLVIQIVLWIVIIFLGWKLWNSVMGPVEFNKIKEARYVKVIQNLKDIQAAELAHKEITGSFTGDWDSLINFIDTAKFAITQRRDTSYADVAKNKAFGISEGYFIEESLIDTLGFTPVKDSLYGSTNRYKTMMNVPVEGVDAKFDLKAGKITKNDATYSVFEAKVSKKVVLGDLDKDLLAQEMQVQSVDGVNGPDIKVGSLEDVNTSGNWPKIYDAAKEN
ncbi:MULTISPECIES: hypothetical protein [Aequorivita]|mgnify:FL=1|jgi:hypothetical protein|uniref:Uncharacterized protein n=2 Tax=Aequorivita TaxID=153265 RepID=A0A137RIZ0_9FLAO|nr:MULTISPECIES: hypothetical protein [Aequorivita]MAB57108.1 hypothetical protein [Aequorivita sp.]KJJ38159.1 hypothetical protein MB09_11105 [Aequorivita vladivostokensis]KXO00156.1 hypothetical protein LS48_06735 [Aequorivita aquimaris]MAO48612.1 hypothetical protein [Aequorivita sp.]MBF30391.1 hypothetical protein [Aequorivita sp.]|tara:strand:- start:130474 stop:131136 length:663 start_codon:yes stop_codon:yes gene_type:complete